MNQPVTKPLTATSSAVSNSKITGSAGSRKSPQNFSAWDSISLKCRLFTIRAKSMTAKKIRLKDGFYSLWLTFYYRFAILQCKVAGEKNIAAVRKEFSFRNTLAGIFCLAFLLRFFMAIPYGNMGVENHLMRPDSLSYCFDAAGFDWGFRAPLPCMIYWLFKQISPNALADYAIFSIFLSSLTIFPAAYLGRLLSKRNSGGIIAALFWCFNITSIGHAPLILSDTLFTFFVAWQVFCAVRAYETKRLIDFAYALGFGTLAALSRGVRSILRSRRTFKTPQLILRQGRLVTE